MKKQLLLRTIVLIALLLFTGCGKNSGKKEEEQQEQVVKTGSHEVVYCDEHFGQATLTEDAAYFHATQNYRGQIRLFSAETKTDIPYCFDPGCEHKPSKISGEGKVLEPGCISFEFSSYPLCVTENACYFLDDDGCLWRADQQGSSRKLICRVSDYLRVPSDVFFGDDSVFLIYYNQYEWIEVKDENGDNRLVIGEQRDKPESGLVRISLETGEETVIFRDEGYNASLFHYDVYGDHVYFSFVYQDIPYVSPYQGEDFDPSDPNASLSVDWAAENEKYTGHRFIDIYDYDIRTKELRTVLFKQHGGNAFFARDCFIKDDDRTGEYELYRYTGEFIRKLPYAAFPRVPHYNGDGLLTGGEKPGEYCLVDIETGEILRKTILPVGFTLYAVVGESCYGYYDGGKKMHAVWLSLTDFWNGDFSKAVALSEEYR